MSLDAVIVSFLILGSGISLYMEYKVIPKLYISKHKNKIQDRINFYFNKYCVDEKSREYIRDCLYNTSLYDYKGNIDEYIDNEIFESYKKILYNKLGYNSYRYSKELKRFEVRKHSVDKYYNFIEKAMDDKNYKNRGMLVRCILEVGNAIEKPMNKVQKLYFDKNLSYKEKNKEIRIIEYRILTALDNFHDLFVRLDDLDTHEINTDVVNDDMFKNIDIYIDSVSEELEGLK